MAYREHAFRECSSPDTSLMAGLPEFDGEEFLKLSPDQRIRHCTQAAERAQNLAKRAPEGHKRMYIEIATQWLLLAEAIVEDEHEKKRSDFLR
jgi:hypothetical protein